MQILHWSFSHPQTGSSVDHSSNPTSPTSAASDRNFSESNVLNYCIPRQSVAQRYPLLTTLLSPQKETSISMELKVPLPQYTNNIVKKEGMKMNFDLDPPRTQSPQDVLITAGDGRRNNPGDDGSRPPGDHYKETDKRVQKRKRKLSEAEEDEEDELLIDSNGYQFEHSEKPYLILNLYAGKKDGYTYASYLPESIEEEARLFPESHVIPYSETYLLDCINNETIPLRLVTHLEQEYNIDLIRYRNCALCEVRDFRRYSSTSMDQPKPVCRQVVLKPSTETLLMDLERLISKSYKDRREYKRLRELDGQNQNMSIEDELIAFKRMRLSHPQYPFDKYEEDQTLIGLHAEVEDKDDLTLDQRHELEKKIAKETAGGLCLDPSKQVGLIANSAQFERFKWNSKELKRSLHLYTRKKQKLSSKTTSHSRLLLSDEEEEAMMEEGEKTVNPLPFSSMFDHEADKSFRRDCIPFANFVKKCVETKKLKRRVDVDKSEILRLTPIKYVDYIPAPPLTTSFEETRRLSQPVEPAILRQVNSENFVFKTEEYIFETERRKHPHRTVVKIFQRNGVDVYYGELEQEPFNDDVTSNPAEGHVIGNPSARGSTIPIKPYVLDPPTGSTGSKCQFELGSIHSVNLYVKQFTDIFTEDGRRACKITFLKAGQPGPTTILTSSYKQMNGNNNNVSVTVTSTTTNASQSMGSIGEGHVGANVVIAHNGAPALPHNSTNTIIVSVPSLPNINQSSSQMSIPIVSMAPPAITSSQIPVSSSSSPSQTNPPVQIVHPQPRPQPNIQISSAAFSQLISTITPTSSALTSTTAPGVTIPGVNASPSTNVNLNLHVNSTRLVQQRHPLLTRPQIYNFNLNSQHQQHLTITRPTTATISQSSHVMQAHQAQHHNQQGIRVKQPTLATLLLTGIPNSGGSKPITVAIQPQPQNQGLSQLNPNQIQAIQLNSSSLEGHRQHQRLTAQGQGQQVIAGHNHGGTQTNNPIMIMVSPATGSLGQNALSIPSNHAHHALPHHTGNVSLNLNTINLEGLLAVSNNSVTHLQQQPTYVTVTSTPLVNNTGNSVMTNSIGLSSVGVGNALNIIRLANNTNKVTLQSQQVVRQNSLAMMSQHQMVNLNTARGTGILLNNSRTGASTGLTTRLHLQQAMRQQSLQVHQQSPPQLEEINVPDLNTLLSNGCGSTRVPTYARSHSKGPSIDVNLNLNLNLSTPGAPTRTAQSLGSPSNEIYSNGPQNGSVVNVNSVDSIFNALSEVIGPELEQKLENSMSQASPHVSSSLSPSTTAISQKSTTGTSIMTLNDLLGSPPMSVSGNMNMSMNHIVSSPMQSPQNSSISSILSPSAVSPNVVTSTIAYTTPRLSALLAGTPSADSSANNILVDTSSARSGLTSANYGNLLDRLMSQGQASTTASVARTGGSRLNPIATATPSVVLDHPVLAATLTQTTNPNLRQALTRPTAYRQIAPAPPPNLQPSSSVTPQQQQLINLLGFMGTNSTNQGVGVSQAATQAIRISTSNNTNNGSSGSNLSR